MWYPTLELIEIIFERQLGYTVQYANKQNLESALDMIKWGIPTQPPLNVWKKAGILMRNIVQFHVFADGCKRIGIHLAYVFLRKNGYILAPKDPEEMFRFPMKVAQGKLSLAEMTQWFKMHSKKKST